MTERHPSDDLVGDDLPPELLVALGDEAVWADAPVGLEDAVVSAIASELGDRAASSSPADGSTSSEQVAPVVDLQSRRRWTTVAMSAAAAALVFIVGFIVVSFVGGSDDADVVLALEATELAPDATAEASIATTELGTRIVLDVRDVPPAPPGTYYEAWLRVDAETGVSAGTFHLRGGDGEIELWSGVNVDDYPLFTVTLQDEGRRRRVVGPRRPARARRILSGTAGAPRATLLP